VRSKVVRMLAAAFPAKNFEAAIETDPRRPEPDKCLAGQACRSCSSTCPKCDGIGLPTPPVLSVTCPRKLSVAVNQPWKWRTS
jgi:hypothetical protein